MDEIDRKLLKMLQEDDRTPYAVMGKELGIGTSTVHFRIKRLVQRGIIKRFTAVVDPDAVGCNTLAWIGLNVDARKMDSVAKKLASFNEVQLVATATGDHDLVVQVVARSDKELWRFINQNIKTIDAISKEFDVSTFLDTYKMSTAIHMDEEQDK